MRHLLAVPVLLTLAMPARVFAFPRYLGSVPNGSSYDCQLCHTSPAGGAGCATPPCLNPFGADFLAAGDVWNDTVASRDSDGDGYTNAMELLDSTRGYSGSVADLGNPAVPGDMDECALAWDTCDAHANCSNLVSG